MTRVLVAHRKETIATADRVVVLDGVKGVVVKAERALPPTPEVNPA